MNVNELVASEKERGTAVGLEIGDKATPAQVNTVLRKVMYQNYSLVGTPSFMLARYPEAGSEQEEIEQTSSFEKDVARIRTSIYVTPKGVNFVQLGSPDRQ